ncbi:prepilin-type N-terminal cleavage/methylation domain-containing protein [Grimontia sp. S25]|uniref:Prepilin-type N-terminal cleavage/methylation domain-containing protein n=2 Tax=Grimontia sedimenti TaxID=2711294 RepID=A0A6M1RWB7_9GAMM|nr:prepilin-type N-terminal cleavage/methylation domain-containing protein [Grimontia sedimenti]
MTLRTKTLHLGMTLLEILIAIAIIGAIATIAVPAVGEYLVKSERSRVQVDLYQLQTHVEQTYTSKGGYPQDPATEASKNIPLICNKCQVSDEYDFSITFGSNNDAYRLQAKPKSTSRQDKDTDCHTMVINAASEQYNFKKDGSAIADNGDCWT